ncbi:hypothetical protein IAI10_17265 [Clostridium sp. 19966]|uniref:hypothetical protein n=1 Tax=Clostridium sp. 19966 TaxID=2768166 RepID=UPI0028DF7F14|nr:hypothetical protein [Clostridium sp. 19966]MDT8718419.1 hypothetical protein [Clostridium sp. 19966]
MLYHFLGQVERGIKKPTIDTLEKIVNSLEITFQELFDFENRIDKREKSTVIDKLTFELNTRSEEEQAIIYDLVKQILKFRDKNSNYSIFTS